jgi:hypothetical protein
MNKFSDFISLVECVERCGGILLPENFHWTKEISALMPKIELDIPTVKKVAKIMHVMDKKNPIYIGLSDGTQLFFTHDEFKRIHGTPTRGKEMIVVLQRHGNDHSKLPSVISQCMVKN